MEKAKEFLKLSEEDSASVSQLTFLPHRFGLDCSSFYEDFILTGVRVNKVEPGFVSCTFKVPPRLTDRSGKLATGAIVNLVDEVGGALLYKGLPRNVTVDISVSFLSSANLNDELEITSKILGKKGGYVGIIVLVKNKTTGELIAEGRHSLFSNHISKI